MTNKEYNNKICLIEPPYEKDKEDIRIALINIIDDWNKDRDNIIKLAEKYMSAFNFIEFKKELEDVK